MSSSLESAIARRRPAAGRPARHPYTILPLALAALVGIGVEGEQSGEWVLVDGGEIVVHIMQPAVRAYYNLEELWTLPAARRRAKPPLPAAA